MGALRDANLGVAFASANMVFLKTIAMMAPTGSSVNHYEAVIPDRGVRDPDA
jgi:hypothetical protein